MPAAASHPSVAQAAEAEFEVAYGWITTAMEHMSAEDQAKEVKPMKPTVRGISKLLGVNGCGVRCGLRLECSPGVDGVPLFQARGSRAVVA